MHPRDVTRDDVRTLKARLMKRGSTMCGGALRVLRLTLTHAMRMDEGVKENPCQFVVIPSTPKRHTAAVDMKEFADRAVQLPLLVFPLRDGAPRSACAIKAVSPVVPPHDSRSIGDRTVRRPRPV